MSISLPEAMGIISSCCSHDASVEAEENKSTMKKAPGCLESGVEESGRRLGIQAFCALDVLFSGEPLSLKDLNFWLVGFDFIAIRGGHGK